MSNLMKILPKSAELFHEDGQPDIVNVLVAFRKFLRTRLKQSFAHPHREAETNSNRDTVQCCTVQV